MATPIAFKNVRPRIEIATIEATPVLTELQCFAKSLVVNFELNTDAASFCEPDGTPDWYLELEVTQSFGADGMWNNLADLANTTVDLTVDPMDVPAAPQTVDNPQITGQCRVPRLPFLSSGIKEYSNFTLRFEADGAQWYQDVGSGPVAI